MKITMTLTEVVREIPAYGKFLKDIITGKQEIETGEVILVCTVYAGMSIPEKMKDPGVFTLPVHIDCTAPTAALCDLGSAVNVLPRRIFDAIDIGELEPPNAILRMADGSLNRPDGVIKDVLITVADFLVPVHLTVVGEETGTVPMLLGRPFLSTL